MKYPWCCWSVENDFVENICHFQSWTVSSFLHFSTLFQRFTAHRQLLSFAVYTCGGWDWWPESDATVSRPAWRPFLPLPVSVTPFHTGHVLTLGQDSTSAVHCIFLFIILFNLSKMSQVFACLINLIGPRPLSLSPLFPANPSCLPQLRLEKASEG